MSRDNALMTTAEAEQAVEALRPVVKAGGAEYEVLVSSGCDDPTCSCGPMIFKSQTDLLMFIRDRLNMGPVSDLVAASMARDIDATLAATQNNPTP